MLDPEPVTCRKVGDAPFARIVAVCHVGDTNVNEALVRAGLALTYIKATDAYVAVEKAAEREKAGVWRGDFVPPSDHRLSRAALNGRCQRQNSRLRVCLLLRRVGPAATPRSSAYSRKRIGAVMLLSRRDAGSGRGEVRLDRIGDLIAVGQRDHVAGTRHLDGPRCRHGLA